MIENLEFKSENQNQNFWQQCLLEPKSIPFALEQNKCYICAREHNLQLDLSMLPIYINENMTKYAKIEKISRNLTPN